MTRTIKNSAHVTNTSVYQENTSASQESSSSEQETEMQSPNVYAIYRWSEDGLDSE